MVKGKSIRHLDESARRRCDARTGRKKHSRRRGRARHPRARPLQPRAGGLRGRSRRRTARRRWSWHRAAAPGAGHPRSDAAGTPTAWRSAASCAPAPGYGRTCRSSCSRPRRPRWTGCLVWSSAPTITSPSPSARASWWRACGRCCAAPSRATERRPRERLRDAARLRIDFDTPRGVARRQAARAEPARVRAVEVLRPQSRTVSSIA